MLLVGFDNKENVVILCVCVNYVGVGMMYGVIVLSNLMESYKFKIFLVIILFVLVFLNFFCVVEV